MDRRERRGLRPFLKWVGGKRQLLPVLRRFYPDSMRPLLRAVRRQRRRVFRSAANGTSTATTRTLSDDNADLIALLSARRRSVDEVIAALERLAARSRRARPRTLPARARRAVQSDARGVARARRGLDDYPTELAAMLIYLNRTGYNGLFRVNASGEYNVPPGRYDEPKVVDRALLTRVSEILADTRDPHANTRRSIGSCTRRAPAISSISIRRTRRSARRRISAATPDAAFGCRSAAPAAGADRAVGSRRPRAAEQLVAPSIGRLYEGNADVAAARACRRWRFPARRAINSRPDRRGTVEERCRRSLFAARPARRVR